MPDAPSLETLHFQHIACAVDLGPQSGPALEWAFQFASEFHAKLTVVHITPLLQGHPGASISIRAGALTWSGKPPR